MNSEFGIDAKDLTTQVLHDTRHRFFMQQALSKAKEALDKGETPVGCVLVYKGEVIGSGMNDTNNSLNGTQHAEFLAIAELLASHSPSVIRETDLYVTVEPCIMNERFGGTGTVLPVHSDPGPDPPYPSHGGLFQNEAINLLRMFYVQENEKAPNPRPKKDRDLKLVSPE